MSQTVGMPTVTPQVVPDRYLNPDATGMRHDRHKQLSLCLGSTV